MNVRPLHDRIIVQRLEEGEQKIGGIIIPDTAKEKPQQGKVIAVGNGKSKDDGKRVPLDVKSGDTILFGKYSGQEIKLDGEEYLIMREDEVLAVIEGKGAGPNKTMLGPWLLGPADRRRPRHPGRSKLRPYRRREKWQNRLCTASTRARRSCAV
jgi:chaperonin GroES